VIVAASDRLCETGWSSKKGYSHETLHRRVQIKLGGEDFVKGDFGEVDLHFETYYFTKRGTKLEASVWNSARPASFAGRSVLVPSPAESVVIGIADGIRSGEGDWAIDIFHRNITCPIEWDDVAQITVERGLVPFVLSGLTYLKSLGCQIPQSALDVLDEARPTAGEYVKYWDFRLRRKGVPHRLRMKVQRLAHKLLPLERYKYDA
jgi:hypothetical protein